MLKPFSPMSGRRTAWIHHISLRFDPRLAVGGSTGFSRGASFRRSSRPAPQACRFVFVLVVSSLLLGCGADEEVAQLDPLDSEQVSGSVLWERITEQTQYTDYGFWPNHDGMRLGQAPHGAFHRIFINERLQNALPAADRLAPNGSIIVKENYTADQELRAITVMAKVEGFAPETNDWFWARYQPDGAIDAEGSVGSCISCHAGMESNDYVIVQPLNRAPEDMPEDGSE